MDKNKRSKEKRIDRVVSSDEKAWIYSGWFGADDEFRTNTGLCIRQCQDGYCSRLEDSIGRPY